MRKKRMKKTEDEIGRQSTSLNFLRVRERKRKGIKRRYWGTFIMTRTTTGWLLWCNIRTFNRKRHRRQQTAAAARSLLLLTLPPVAVQSLACWFVCQAAVTSLLFFTFSILGGSLIPLDLFRVSLTRLEFQYFSIYRNLFVNWKNNETIFKKCLFKSNWTALILKSRRYHQLV